MSKSAGTYIWLISLCSTCNVINAQTIDREWFAAPHVAYSGIYHQKNYGFNNSLTSPFLLGLGIGTKGKSVSRICVNGYMFQHKKDINDESYAQRRYLGYGLSYDYHVPIISGEKNKLLFGAMVGFSRQSETITFQPSGLKSRRKDTPLSFIVFISL